MSFSEIEHTAFNKIWIVFKEMSQELYDFYDVLRTIKNLQKSSSLLKRKDYDSLIEVLNEFEYKLKKGITKRADSLAEEVLIDLENEYGDTLYDLCSEDECRDMINELIDVELKNHGFERHY